MAAVRETTNQRKTNLVKKMRDLDEFFLEFISNGKVELAQGTLIPGAKDPHTKGVKRIKEPEGVVVFWDRLSLSWLAVPVKSVKSIRSLQTVMTNTLRPL